MVSLSKVTKLDFLPRSRLATLNDFRTNSGKFNCRKRKYYYWCKSNLKYMVWYTFPYDTIEAMQEQIDALKTKIRNKEILVDE